MIDVTLFWPEQNPDLSRITDECAEGGLNSNNFNPPPAHFIHPSNPLFPPLCGSFTLFSFLSFFMPSIPDFQGNSTQTELLIKFIKAGGC